MLSSGRGSVIVHKLKCWPTYFSEAIAKRKPFEIRKDDRGFLYGDTLHLREWSPTDGRYTGRECKFKVTAVYRNVPGVLPDHVAMTIERRAPGDRAGMETSVECEHMYACTAATPIGSAFCMKCGEREKV
jgi:hypothetical protein